MRPPRHDLPRHDPPRRPALRIAGAGLLLLCAGLVGAGSARAQYDDEGDGAPRRYRYEEERVVRPPPVRRAAGLNCDAVQSGLTGYQPFSCPLPGPRPLGARCYCETPVSFLSGPQTAVGRVVP